MATQPSTAITPSERSLSVGSALPETTTGNGKERPGTLRGGHDPREMAARSAAVRRQKREQREEKWNQRLARLDHKLLNVLEEQLDSSDPAVRQRAAMYLIDRLYGKPTMKQEIEQHGSLDIAANPDEVRQWLVAKLGDVATADNTAPQK